MEVITKVKLPDGNTYEVGGAGILSITYADLVAKVNGGELVPGQQYRITDYVTTTAQANTQSAGHAFDVIVTADSTDTLNENARAVLHEGDTYFASQNLAAWELKYDIKNNTTKYAWADRTNGKGVIYEMIDEFGNRAGYDFKNIQFRRYKISSQSKGNDMAWLVNSYAGRYSVTSTSSRLPSFATFNTSDSIYMFTFGIRTTAGVISDASLNASGKYCFENVIEPYYYNNKRYLNGITFHNTSATQNMYGNEFDANCRDMWFYSNCYANKFKDNCDSNTFGQSCNSNTFGQICSANTFGQGCSANTFGQGCSANTFGQGCRSNTFGQICSANTFGQICSANTFGQDCNSNTFGQDCNSNTFGQGCNSNTFGQGCRSNTFGQICSANTFGQQSIGNRLGNYIMNIEEADGASIQFKHIDVTYNDDYDQWVDASDETIGDYGWNIPFYNPTSAQVVLNFDVTVEVYYKDGTNDTLTTSFSEPLQPNRATIIPLVATGGKTGTGIYDNCTVTVEATYTLGDNIIKIINIGN